MNKFLMLGGLVVAAGTVAGCSGGASPSAPGVQTPNTAQSEARKPSEFELGIASGRFARVCDAAAAGFARCHAVIRTDTGAGRSPQGGSAAATTVSGYTPARLQAAYKIAGLTSRSGAVVAIVDAYDDPNLENDLGVYRARFGLTSCTTANGCFKKLNQSGGTTYPKANASWAQETSLDVDMVSANCPTCKILVVEANSSSFADLATAVKAAGAVSGVVAISNSYGGSESSSDSNNAAAYNQTGKAITASTGDSGYGAQSPAAFGTVIATGGTTLTSAANTRGWTETVWSGAGSGCSAYQAKPSFQHDSGCARRTIGDVAYDADPNSGVAVYDSLSYRGQSGWLVFGGTSVASPAIAAISALGATQLSNAANLYTNTSALFDVTSGSNGTCSVAYLCTGEVGYDGPTGNGTPNGVAAF